MSGDKVPLLCNYGGHFANEAGRIIYNGGSTRGTYVTRDISYSSLLSKMREVSMSGPPNTGIDIKYRYPGIDFDSSLVDIKSDDDVQYNSNTMSNLPRHNIMGTSRGVHKRELGSRNTRIGHNQSSVPITTNSPQSSAADRRDTIMIREQQLSDGPSITNTRNVSESLSDSSNTDLEPDGDDAGLSIRSMDDASPSNFGCKDFSKEIGSCEKALVTLKDLRGNEGISDCGQRPTDSLALKTQVGFEESDDESSHSLKVGQIFVDGKAFNKALREFAMYSNFEYKPVRTSKNMSTAKCINPACPWRIHASRLPEQPTFKIKTYNPVHTCVMKCSSSHRQASIAWIASVIQEQVQTNLNYTPKEIVRDIKRQFNVDVSYAKAWRAKQDAMGAIRGSYKESFKALPGYCKEIERTNPGSVTELICDRDSVFLRLYWAFSASIRGFLNACRPFLEVDGAQLTGRCSGVFLCATAVDANNESFPVAFAIAESESNASWTWFLTVLRRSLGEIPRLTIISNRENGLQSAVKEVFPEALHGFCMARLSESFCKLFRNDMLRKIFWKAALACTRQEFELHMSTIEGISKEAVSWINSIPTENWATAFFKGDRYNILTSNIAESFNNWLNEARDSPIISLVECIHIKMMELFNQRRDDGGKWTGMLTPFAEKYIAKMVQPSRQHDVRHCRPTEFEIISHEQTFFVDLGQRTCSCRQWEVQGLPCSHAIAAIHNKKYDVCSFCQDWFYVAKYQATYLEAIHPVLDASTWEGDEKLSIEAPPTKKRPGRPRKNKICSEPSKPLVHCSNCKQIGHNRRSCRDPSPVQFEVNSES
ncbi:hypothetical protein AMTR_s00012p00235430 [Amborella trichopoda]|uniref:SWIM-type domain-containing protein n=1 Tax=Amborella trichopoda TaxID=13333 RepID=W1PJR6_AMBTC|nr:hypothetical protein AMTR_s00012p00235430 [Amborella trichopoda]